MSLTPPRDTEIIDTPFEAYDTLFEGPCTPFEGSDTPFEGYGTPFEGYDKNWPFDTLFEVYDDPHKVQGYNNNINTYQEATAMALIKYDNDMNSVQFRRFNAKEMNVFFALCYALQDEGGHEVTMSFRSIKSLSGWTNKQTLDRFLDSLRAVNEKIMSLKITRDNGRTETTFALFIKFVLDKENEQIKLAVNPELADLFTMLFNNFTTFILEDLEGITTTYGKELFRQIKQFRQTGKLYMTIDEFRHKLAVPDTYSNGKMMQKVFRDTTVKQLKSALPGFSMSVVKSHQRGGAITGIWFFWTPERPNEDYFKRQKQIK